MKRKKVEAVVGLLTMEVLFLATAAVCGYFVRLENLRKEGAWAAVVLVAAILGALYWVNRDNSESSTDANSIVGFICIMLFFVAAAGASVMYAWMEYQRLLGGVATLLGLGALTAAFLWMRGRRNENRSSKGKHQAAAAVA